jgi:large subunit ribosomal protein L30
MPSPKKPAAPRARKTGARTPAKKTAAPRRRTTAAESAPAAPRTEVPAPAEAAPAGPPARRVRAKGGATITIEQYRSGIACIERQKRTLRALGLRRPRQRVVRPDNPAVRGMVEAIPHLVRIVEGA